MTRLAIAAQPDFAVDPLELNRAGASFTLDTARELKRRGMQEVHWLIGADLLPQLHIWHDAANLFQEVIFWVLERPGSPIDWPSLPTPTRALRERLLPAPLLDISATNIRERIAMALPIDFLTPPAVVTYIREHRLYGTRT